MLELLHISKLFPGVRALDDVSIAFRPGEIHAIMGENGAGKSTLMKIVCGIYQADAGYIDLDSKRIAFRSVKDAMDADISMVSQEIQVLPTSTVAENICMDHIQSFSKMGHIHWKDMNKAATECLATVGLTIPPTQIIAKLTVAQKQLIQIAKAISTNAKYIFFDEPTSALTKFETNTLMQIIRKLKARGVGIVFVSHKIEEVIELCDKVTVLRDGKYVGTLEREQFSRAAIIQMMIGRAEMLRHRGFLDVKPEMALDVQHLVEFGRFKDINFNVHKGEIVGFYGLVGSGRTELARLVIGDKKRDGGEILVDGKRAEIRSISDSLYKYRMGYITENRKEEGLMLDAGVDDNISITIWSHITNKVRKINRKQEAECVDAMVRRMQIKCPSVKTKAGSLSGGNQQKVSFAKWIAAACDILFVDEPTIGVDIGAKEYIHDLIWELAALHGKAVVLISSDLPELISLARRIYVFAEGEIREEITGLNDKAYTYEETSSMIGQAMM